MNTHGLITRSVLSDLKNVRINLVRESGTWYKPGRGAYDSRTNEWSDFMTVISTSDLGLGPVLLQVWYPCDFGIEAGPEIKGDMLGELFEYARSLPLKKLSYENHSPRKIIGYFAEARVAIPAVLDALKRPPLDKCPWGAQVLPGQTTCCLILIFENARFVVDVFVE